MFIGSSVSFCFLQSVTELRIFGTSGRMTELLVHHRSAPDEGSSSGNEQSLLPDDNAESGWENTCSTSMLNICKMLDKGFYWIYVKDSIALKN